MKIFKPPPPPLNATERIWLEINFEVPKYNSDNIIAIITDESWNLWESLDNATPENKELVHMESALKFWQLSQIAKVSLAQRVENSTLEFTSSILETLCSLLDPREFFLLDDPTSDLREELLFRRELARFDPDPASENARFSFIFSPNQMFNSSDCISVAPWVQNIGVSIEKVFPIVHLLRIIASNDLRNDDPDHFVGVRGAIPPVESWFYRNDEAIRKYIDDFRITESELNSFIAKNTYDTKTITSGLNEDPFFHNPLLDKPMVKLGDGTVLVPIIPLLHNLSTEGLYYRWREDPDFGLSGRIHRNGIQNALGTRFANYVNKQLKIDTERSEVCWTDYCDCSRSHTGEGADFVIFPRTTLASQRSELIVEAKSKRFGSTFLSALLTSQPRQLTPQENEKLEDVLGHAIDQINNRAAEKPDTKALGLIVFLTPIPGANALINNPTYCAMFGLPVSRIPIYAIASKDFEIILSLNDFDLILAYLQLIIDDETWKQDEFLDGLAAHSGKHFSHQQNNICTGVHECQHVNPCVGEFPCLHLADNLILREEMIKFHLPLISD